MYQIKHVGWSGGNHEGYHVGDYFAAANVDAEATYSTERGACEAMRAVTMPDSHGVAPVLAIEECE